MVGTSPREQRLFSLRSPLPVLVGGIAVALLLIAIATLPPRPSTPDLSRAQTLSESEAVALVAREIRSPESAVRVSTEGRARYDDGSWFVTAGQAEFRFSERNRIVMPENDAARLLQYDGGPPR
jgi:hypothetical protein